MREAWDTTVVSHVAPASRHHGLLAARLAGNMRFSLTAPTVQEVIRGAAAAPAALRWYRELLGNPLLDVLVLDAAAADLAGRLQSSLPHPPATARRRSGHRTQQRLSWLIDIQIAACAYTNGYAITTENRHDFDVLSDAIAALDPSAPPLEVRGA